MRWSDEIDEIAAALVAFTEAVGPVPKNRTGKISGKNKHGESYSYTYAYADLSDQREHARAALVANGLSVVQSVASDGGQVAIQSLLMHKSGQWIESDTLLIPTDGSAQAQGSAMTYGKRYQYGALLGIAGEEDDDGKNATDTNDTPAPRAPSGGITPKQAGYLVGKAKEYGYTRDDITVTAKRKYGLTPDDSGKYDLVGLTKAQMDELLAAMKAHPRTQGDEEIADKMDEVAAELVGEDAGYADDEIPF
jgi:hypothetical protein